MSRYIDMNALRLVTLLLQFVTITAYAGANIARPDYAREQRWADEITPDIIVGAPVYLEQKNKHKFLSILAEAKNANTAILIAHGMGLNPEWGLYGALRQGLFDNGFTTIGLQMPVLAADAKPEEYPQIFPDAVERLTIAADFLHKKGYQRIVLVSHSNGSLMSRQYMLEKPSLIKGWAALSMTRQKTFSGIDGPILDIYAELDLDHVLSSVDARKLSLGSNAASKQIVVKDADHFYGKHEDELIVIISQFITSIVE